MIPEKGNVTFQKHTDKCIQVNTEKWTLQTQFLLLKANVQAQEIAVEKHKGVSRETG